MARGVVRLLAFAAFSAALMAASAVLSGAPSCPPSHVWSEVKQLCVCDPAPGATITCGKGVCQVTVAACNSAGVANQCTPKTSPTPGQDVCNGKDDDCDGLIDEDDANTTVSCGLGRCAGTSKACVGGTWVGSAWCEVDMGQKRNETCNGVDDDCDGVVDNVGFQSCGKGACAVTVPRCTNGTEAECKPGRPSDEKCNNLDDDCDGLIDEDLGNIVCQVGTCTKVIPACFEGRALTTADCFAYPDPNCITALPSPSPGAAAAPPPTPSGPLTTVQLYFDQTNGGMFNPTAPVTPAYTELDMDLFVVRYPASTLPGGGTRRQLLASGTWHSDTCNPCGNNPYLMPEVVPLPAFDDGPSVYAICVRLLNNVALSSEAPTVSDTSTVSSLVIQLTFSDTSPVRTYQEGPFVFPGSTCSSACGDAGSTKRGARLYRFWSEVTNGWLPAGYCPA